MKYARADARKLDHRHASQVNRAPRISPVFQHNFLCNFHVNQTSTNKFKNIILKIITSTYNGEAE